MKIRNSCTMEKSEKRTK